MNKISSTKIAIIGLGYVGLPLAVEFGKIYKTIGFDINPRRIEELSIGNDRTFETTSEELNEAVNLTFTFDVNDIKECNVFIVTVPTPINKANRPDLTPLIEASKTVGLVLKKSDVVIYESTVYPGATEEVCVPVLERISGKIFNIDFFCGYSPERINPGDKVNTLTKIVKITSGSTIETSNFVDQLYASIITAGTYNAGSLKVAEAAKVIENTQRDLNIALVNELSLIFNRLNIDTLEVLLAAGSKWNFLPFRPGMVGGHCIGVDPYYLTHKAEEVGYSPQVILAGRRINDEMSKYAAEIMVKRMLQCGINVAKSTVGVLGITFKENCPDIRNSKVADLINELQQWNINVVVFDPWADSDEVFNEYGIRLSVLEDLKELDSLIVAVGHRDFRGISPSTLKSYCKLGGPFVIGDLKCIYDRHMLEAEGFSVFRL